MKRVSAHSVGVVFAGLLGTWHFVWALLVATGAGQIVLDFIFRLHMIVPPYRVAAFDPATAAGLVFGTAAIGYIAGLLAGFIWNRWAKDGTV